MRRHPRGFHVWAEFVEQSSCRRVHAAEFIIKKRRRSDLRAPRRLLPGRYNLVMDPLNEVEVRVLGALVEKDITTPDYYPLP